MNGSQLLEATKALFWNTVLRLGVVRCTLYFQAGDGCERDPSNRSRSGTMNYLDETIRLSSSNVQGTVGSREPSSPGPSEAIHDVLSSRRRSVPQAQLSCCFLCSLVGCTPMGLRTEGDHHLSKPISNSTPAETM